MPNRKVLDPTTLAELTTALQSKNYKERRDAVNQLGKYKDPQAIEWLVRALKDTTVTVRRRAVAALSKYKHPALIPYMLPLLKDKTCNSHRLINKTVLDLGIAAEPYLLEALKDKHRLIRCAVAQLLAEIGSQQAVEPLIRLIDRQNHDDSFFVITALQKIGNAQAVETLLEVAQDAAALPEVRRCAASGLQTVADDRITMLYLSWLDEANPLLRATALRCLMSRKLPAETLLPLLLDATVNPDRQVAYQAFQGLENFVDEPQVFERVVALVSSPGPNRAYAVRVLGYSHNPRTVELLKQWQEDRELRGSVAEVLAQLHHLTDRQTG